MSEFAEADARLGDMHGYAPQMDLRGCVILADRQWLVLAQALNLLDEQQARIEAKLDRLMQALSAGAVGDWR